MKALWLSTLLLVTILAPLALAGDCHNRNIQREVVREVFRVGDGVFIGQRANVAYYAPLGNYYATNPEQFSGKSQNAELAQAVAELTFAVQQLSQGQSGATRGVDSLSFVHKVCNQCHSGANAKGNFRTDVDLSAEDRLLAITMIMHDNPAKRMPKGRVVEAAIMSKLVQQLSTPPGSASQLPAQPQSPEPPQAEQYQLDNPPPRPSGNGY